MNVVLMWGTTTIISILIENFVQHKMVKTLGNNGYELEKGTILELSNYLPTKFNLNVIIIPGINMLYCLSRLIETLKIRKICIDALEESNCIISEENKAINLLNIKVKTKDEEKPTSVISYMENGIENIIYFKEKNEEYLITKTDGPISQLSRKLQLEKLRKEMSELGQSNFC